MWIGESIMFFQENWTQAVTQCEIYYIADNVISPDQYSDIKRR